MTLDQNAALESASWGIGQVLGENFVAAGFSDPLSMARAMCGGEDIQVMALCKFATSNGLDRLLRNHDWAGFALGYNGPDYAQYSYDTKLLQNYQRYSTRSRPDLTVRAAQLLLTFLSHTAGVDGYNPGVVDGWNGPRTESAVKALQSARGLPATGEIDDQTMAALQAAVGIS